MLVNQLWNYSMLKLDVFERQKPCNALYRYYKNKTGYENINGYPKKGDK